MRCLHIVPTYWPAVRYGGTVFAVRALCSALAQGGDQVSVYTTSANGRAKLDVPVARPIRVDGVEVTYFPWVLYRPCYAPAMGRALIEAASGVDVIHLHSVFLWPTLAGARAARRAGIPYIVSPRGMLVRELIDRRHRLLKTAWLQLVETRTLHDAAAIHVTSELEAEQIRTLKLDLAPLHTIPNGIDEPATSVSMPAEVRASLGLRCDEPFVLYLGRLTWKKGLDRLVRAMRYVIAARLVIAGNDDENYWSGLNKIIVDEGLSERVTYCGPAYDDRKWSLLRAASCFVLPSHSENFGNTVLEAMSVGCPAVVTTTVGASRLLESARAGLVVSGEPESIGRAISYLLLNDDVRTRMSAAGMRAAREEHTWSRRAREMQELYRNVVSQKRRAFPG